MLAVTALATSATSAGASAQAGVAPGRGLALGETAKLDPRFGSLSLGITAGRSIAGHQNSVAQASSQAIDLGEIGSTLASEGCDGGAPTLPADKQPQAIQVDSRQPNSTQEADEDKLPVPAHKYASANGTPYGEAVTTTAPLDLSVIKIGGGVSRAHSGLLDDGTTREAQATVDISGVEIPLAGVQLSGLHWEATWRSTDPQNGVAGVFSIGSASIQGKQIPVTDPTQALTQINGTLAPLGIEIKPPKAYENSGVVFVDSMGVSIFPSPTRDGASGVVLKTAQPVRQDLVDALLKQSCSNASYITILDLIIGSITGAGSFGVVLGGVQASSGEAYQNQYCLGCGGGLTPSLGTSNSNSVLSSSSGTALGTNKAAGSPSTPSSSNGGGGGGAPAATAAVTPAASTKGKGARGGALAGVGLASLALLGLMAEGDRRKMRRAQREIPQFEE